MRARRMSRLAWGGGGACRSTDKSAAKVSICSAIEETGRYDKGQGLARNQSTWWCLEACWTLVRS